MCVCVCVFTYIIAIADYIRKKIVCLCFIAFQPLNVETVVFQTILNSVSTVSMSNSSIARNSVQHKHMV